MKIIVSTLFLSLCLNMNCIAQLLNNSPDGESAAKYPGGAISFDPGAATLGFTYLYYGDSSGIQKGYFGGINFNAKNAEGIANLFSKGDFTPEGKGKLVLGHTWVFGRDKKASSALDSLNKILQKKDSVFRTKLKANIDVYLKSEELSPEKYRLVKDKIIDNIGNLPPKKIGEAIDRVVESDSTLSRILTIVKKGIFDAYEQHNNERDKLKDQIKELGDALANTKVKIRRLSIYTEGGINALSFKRYKLVDSANLSNNFTDQNFQGGDLRLGINYRWGGRFLFGLAAGYRNYHNFTLLSDKEYTLKNTISNSFQQQSAEKKFTAYSGTFGKVDQTYFLVDMVYFQKIDKKNIVAADLYFKNWISSKTSVYPNVMDLGLSLFFFKPSTGKFSGGVYVELPDMNNNLEKMEEEPNLREPKNRLSFGVVAKFNLGSLPGFSN